MKLKKRREEKLNINIIILGAGYSKRFNGNKLFYEIDGKPMYLHTIEKMKNIKLENDNIKNIIFVTQYFKIICDLRRDSLVHCVINSHPERGISSSMNIGLAYSLKLMNSTLEEGEIVELDTDNSTSAYLFSVSDQPYLSEKSISQFLEAFIKSKKGIGCMSSSAGLGNPVIFRGKYIPELLSLKGDIGGKKIVNKHLNDTFIFEVQDKEIKDIDSL